MADGGVGQDLFLGKRVLVTSADRYMGPVACRQFKKEGAEVISDLGGYESDPDEPRRVVAAAGHIDILVVNLLPKLTKRQLQVDASEDDWQAMFNTMTHPTARFVRAVLPQMLDRKEGKIILVTSAAPLRGVPASAAYTAARGAQNAYVLAVGAEIAEHNVQINAIAQNFVYGGYPDNAMEIESIREEVHRDVPARRFAQGWEQAELVLFLASQNSNFINGQIIPFAGGWVT